MSYNNKEDDVIVFDPFDDEAYNKWLKARQDSLKYDLPQNPVITRIEFPTEQPTDGEPVQTAAAEPAPHVHTNAQAAAEPVQPQKAATEKEKPTAVDKPAAAESKSDGEKPLTAEQKKRRLIQNIAEIALYLIMAVLIIKFVPKYVMERVSVEGESMKETLQDGDQLIGEKLSIRFGSLKRYDIIYFAPKGNHKAVDFIKRIIGLPGETIYIENSVVYVNGRPLQEDFACEAEFLAYTASSPIFLGADEYFVMGDNRNHSTDSRFSSVGVVHLKDIEGRAVFKLWPLSGFGKID